MNFYITILQSHILTLHRGKVHDMSIPPEPNNSRVTFKNLPALTRQVLAVSARQGRVYHVQAQGARVMPRGLNGVQ